MNPLSVVRSDALLDKELQKCPAVYMTLAAIATFTTRNKDGYCYFKQETIAEHLGKSRQAISQHIVKLADLGYIEVISQTYRGFKSNNAYRIRYEGPVNDGASSPCSDASSPCTTTQAHLAAKCSSINAEKEKGALTLTNFLIEVSGGFNSGAFNEFDLEEREIIRLANMAYDLWAGTGRFPEGCAVAYFRNYIRKSSSEAKLSEHVKKNLVKGTAEDRENGLWRMRMQGYQKNGFWRSDHWGVEPSHQNTQVPACVLSEFNINQKQEVLENA
tara:strand:+ start:4565 stop:5383 length:819 start_codon:yes stop_codon:yes gene_type:complete